MSCGLAGQMPKKGCAADRGPVLIMIHDGILGRETKDEIVACREPSEPDGFGPDGAVASIHRARPIV